PTRSARAPGSRTPRCARCRAWPGPPDLSELTALRGGARSRRIDGPAGPVGVQRPGDAVRLEHLPERGHAALGPLPRLVVNQLRVEQPLGGVIDDDEEGLPAVGHERQPAMAAAV